VVGLLIAFAFIIANGFFVAAEFALVKVRATSLESKAAVGDLRAKRALKALEKLEEYLSAAQLGITLASLALGWVGEPAMTALIAPHLHGLGLSTAWP